MGISGKKGTIRVLTAGCPVPMDGAAPSQGEEPSPFDNEVIKFDVTPSAYKKEYGHDKSEGWQDVCYGIKRLEGTIEVKMDRGARLEFGPAQIVYLKLYPTGVVDNAPLQGYAGIDSTPLSVNIENGEPVSATYRFSSKGKWTGFPNDDAEWGGFECEGSSAGE